MAAGAAPDQQDACHGAGAAEWRVNVPDVGEHDHVKSGTWRRSCSSPPSWSWLFSWMATPRDRVAGFGRMVWKVGADDPRRVVHGLKVALALTLCSIFYYVHPLYDFTAGMPCGPSSPSSSSSSTPSSHGDGGRRFAGPRRALGRQPVGKELQPYVLTGSMFVMTSVATFSRFIPTMKAKFDYGVTIFILTYCLVSVSGYRADEVVYLAQQRLTTVAIGAFICFAVCAFVFPVWAGQELHLLVARNMDKLAAAAEGCVEDYFSDPATTGARRTLSEKSGLYKLVLNAKANEDSLANLARWSPATADAGAHQEAPRRHLPRPEPPPGRRAPRGVGLRHVDDAVRPPRPRRGGHERRRPRPAGRAEVPGGSAEEGLEDESSEAEHELINAATPPLIEALPLFSAASLLLEVCARAEGVVGAVETLATTARFRKADHDEKAALDTEASVPVCTNNLVDADVSQEVHVKIAGEQEKTETAHKANASSGNAPRDQVGELIKVLMRRRSSKKWSKGDTKVSPKPPLDLAVTVPSPRNRAMELAGHGPVGPSPRNRPAELAGHATAMPSPRHRAVELPATRRWCPAPGTVDGLREPWTRRA
ncbi:hypothetical protein ACQ4PT_045053 [Festuca glaucescens]